VKGKILFLSVIWLCCALAYRVEAQQKKRPQRAVAQQQGASSLEGNWTGKAEQNMAITFTVLKGRITEFSAGGRFQGYGCSSTSTTNTTVNQPIVNKSFSFSSPGGPGGISLRRYDKGEFHETNDLVLMKQLLDTWSLRTRTASR